MIVLLIGRVRLSELSDNYNVYQFETRLWLSMPSGEKSVAFEPFRSRSLCFLWLLIEV